MTINLTAPQAPVTDEELDQMIWKLERDGMTPKMLSLMRELREVRKTKPMVDSDLLHAAASAIEDLLTTKDRSGAHTWYDIPMKLREAAHRSLNAEKLNQPVSNTYKLPSQSSNDVNDAAWKLYDMLTDHGPLNGRQFNNLKECFYGALKVAMRNSPAAPDGWKVEAERLAELHGCSFVVFRHGEEPQCADPTKVIISFTDKGLGYSDAVSAPATHDCQCRTCRPVTMNDMRLVVCTECGNKRCPHANDHNNACTGSNEPGQVGSAYPAAPKEVG